MTESDHTPSSAIADRSAAWVSRASWFGLCGMLLACLSRVTAVDPDLFHELALIREAIQLGHLPTVDSFAYTPTLNPIVHHEWGTGALLYLATITSGLGMPGLIVVEYVLCLFIAIGSYVCARRRGASESVFALLAPLAIIMAWIGFSTVRAQVFTLAFVVALQLILTLDVRHRKWTLPLWLLVYVVWLNLHAGFLVGFGLFLLHTVECLTREAIDRKSVWLAFCETKSFIACLFVLVLLVAVNPYGWDYYHYLWRAVLLSRLSVTEWQPLWRVSAWELLWALIFSQFINLYVIRARGIRPLAGIAIVTVTALLAFRHARHLSIYAVVWICCAPAWVEHTALAQKVVRLWYARSRWVCAFWIALGLLGVAEACRNRFWEPQIPTSPVTTPYAIPIYPVGAMNYLSEHSFRGNLHTPFIVGAYVSWRLSPAVRVSTDGRYEVAYPPGQVEELEAVYQGKPNWESVLNKYHADAILVPWWSPLGKLLQELQPGPAGWRQIYQDGAYTVFVRSNPIGP